jgi:hypothetical protein
MNAAAGIVRIQAQTMRPATPHFTADNLRVAPMKRLHSRKEAEKVSRKEHKKS